MNHAIEQDAVPRLQIERSNVESFKFAHLSALDVGGIVQTMYAQGKDAGGEACITNSDNYGIKIAPPYGTISQDFACSNLPETAALLK